MISFDLVFLLDPAYPSARRDGAEIPAHREGGEVSDSTDLSTLPGEIMARAIVATSQPCHWPIHLQMAVATGALREDRRVGWISGNLGRFAPEWQTVAEHLAEALRLGTSTQVSQALDLFDSTKEAMEGAQEVPADTNAGSS